MNTAAKAIVLVSMAKSTRMSLTDAVNAVLEGLDDEDNYDSSGDDEGSDEDNDLSGIDY